MKECADCGDEIEDEDIGFTSEWSDGVQYVCIRCHEEMMGEGEES